MNKENSSATSQKKDDLSAQSTQRYLQFSEVHDDVLVLRDGGIRGVLEISSMNFNLKSEDEQKATIYSFQKFLNALNFPVQMLVQSRKLDIEQYLNTLQAREKEIKNDLLREQLLSYIKYIERLIEYSDIMEKKFYVIVPIPPPAKAKKGLTTGFLEYIMPKDNVIEILKRKKAFGSIKKELDSNINIVKTGLENCGLNATQLNTEKIIELFYSSYNSNLARRQKIVDIDDLAVEMS